MPSVTLLYKFREYRTSVEGSTSLSEILENGCRYFKLDYHSGYDLIYRNVPLDLSLPYRLANLPGGVKLNIVKGTAPVEESTTSMVTIKLQIIAPEGDSTFKQPDPGSLIEKFPSTTIVWDVLIKYSDSIGTQLAERTGQRDDLKLKKRIYCKYEPILQSMSKVVEGEQLKTSTLKSLGLTSGSHSLRLRFRRIDTSAEDIDVSAKKAKVEETVKESKEQVKESVKLQSEPVGRSVEPVEPVEPAQPAAITVQSEVSGPTQSSPSPMKPVETIQVFTNTFSTPLARDDSDSIYDMTLDQAKIYQASLSKRASGGPMMTRAQKLEAEEKKRPVVTSCLIRIRFPDYTTIQLELPAGNTLNDLYNLLVNDILALTLEEEALAAESQVFFELVTTHPKVKVLDTESDLDKQLVAHCGLGKRSLLLYREKTPGKDSFVREKYLEKAKPLNELSEFKGTPPAPEPKSSRATSHAKTSTSSKGKVPKWFMAGKR